MVVSICMQTYNHAKFIKQCLDSILMQETNFPFEIILGEDESSDDTREICIEYANKYPDKIKLFLRSRKDVIYINGNATGRFNMLENLNACQGKYVALCEGDDYWTDPLKLQKQVDLLEANPNLVACHHWQKNAIEKNGIFIEIDSPKKGHGYLSQTVSNVVDIFLNKMRVKTRTVMFRNIIDKNFFPDWFNNVAYGDVPLSFLMGKYGDFGFINEEMAVYRQTETGVSKAGLKELGSKEFRIQHFKNWIEIWDYANTHYNYKYNEEAVKTVAEFYNSIFSNLDVAMSSVLLMLKYNLFERRLSILKTFPHTKLIILFYKNRIGKKVKRKLFF